MRSDEDVVGALGPIPKRVLGLDELDGGGYESPGVTNGWESIDGAEIAGHVDRNEEEVGFVRVNGQKVAGQQRPMNCHLRGKQLGSAPIVGEPLRVVFRRQIVHENLQPVEQS